LDFNADGVTAELCAAKPANAFVVEIRPGTVRVVLAQKEEFWVLWCAVDFLVHGRREVFPPESGRTAGRVGKKKPNTAPRDGFRKRFEIGEGKAVRFS
jgi:hypothetical protein